MMSRNRSRGMRGARARVDSLPGKGYCSSRRATYAIREWRRVEPHSEPADQLQFVRSREDARDALEAVAQGDSADDGFRARGHARKSRRSTSLSAAYGKLIVQGTAFDTGIVVNPADVQILRRSPAPHGAIAYWYPAKKSRR